VKTSGGRPWDEVGDGCFRRRYESYDLNIGVVRGADALLLFDTRCHDGEVAELLDELRVFGTRPIRWVVNSHWHFDHTFGNGAVQRAAARGVEIWGHRVMRDELLRWGDDRVARLSAERPEWEAELDAVEIVPPDHLVDRDAVIDLGDRAVELRHFGPAHTGGDLVAFADGGHVVYAGDLVEEGAPPAIGLDAHPFDWPVSNASMVANIAPDATVVPGHGDVVDRAFVVRQRDELAIVAALIRELFEAGVAREDALAHARGRWPFSEDDLCDAVPCGYAELARTNDA
jgi:glyoxylase-like metal-dependent hydrolase (beta-lactamase superfamily II)